MSMTSVVCNVPVLSQNDSTHHQYIGTAGPGSLASAILSSYAPINHQPVRLDVTYDVIGNPHYPYVIVDLGLQLTLQLED